MRTLDRTSKIVLSALSVLVGTCLAAGCGDDGDGGGGDVSTGIAPSKLLSDVTDEEAQSACQRLQAGFDRVFAEDELIRVICTLGAAVAEDTTADCVTTRDACIDAANMQGSGVMQMVDEIDEFTCDGEGDADLAECTGTVGQLETCFNDTIDRVEALFDQFSCDDAATLDEKDLDDFGSTIGEPPASCEAVGCPGDSPFAPDEDEISSP